MSKIYKLREWLTVSEAAKQLSILFGEEVTEADLLRLALDRRLRLSVYFVNHAMARCGKVIPWEETDWWLFPNSDSLPGGRRILEKADSATGVKCQSAPTKLAELFNEIPEGERDDFYPLMRSLNIDGERFVTLSDNVTTLRGVWDLPMIGGEKLDVEHMFQNLTDGPSVTLQNIDGAFVEGPDGVMCQIQEDFDDNEYQPGSSAALERLKQHIAENNIKGAKAESLLARHNDARKKFQEERTAKPAKDRYYPRGGLPEDAVIVVRTEALREFEQSVNGPPVNDEKPIQTTERNSLLTIIAALCDYSAIKYQDRGAANHIVKLTEEIGAAVSDDTVRRALAKIPEALETRRK